MTNKAWSFLKPGDIVDIIAPSSAAPVEDLAQYYAKVKDAFAKIGLVARIADDLITIGEDPFSANSLEYRANSIIEAFTNSDSKAIWAIRGGYGAAKLIPFLEKLDPPKTSKLLLGFSDVTALHLFLENKWKRCSMHSAVINQIIMNPSFLEELRPILFGDTKKITYNQLVPLNSSAKINQHIKASITGGNLSIVQTSLATSWQIEAKDKIIFLEDVGEQGYRIDRMLNQLLQAGVFKNAKAVIFGEITPPIGIEPDLCGVAIENFAKTLDIPVLSLPIIGHSIKHNSPLPLGSECELILGEGAAELACDSGGR